MLSYFHWVFNLFFNLLCACLTPPSLFKIFFYLLLAYFCVLAFYVSGKSKIKVPVPKWQKVSLISRYSAHQTLQRLHSSRLTKSTGSHCKPETWQYLGWSLSHLLSNPLSLGKDNHILSYASWWIRTGIFGDTCSSARSTPATARAE